MAQQPSGPRPWAGDPCPVQRTKLMRHFSVDMRTGEHTDQESTWVTEACGAPMFTAAELAANQCRSCSAGWSHPENYPTAKGRPA